MREISPHSVDNRDIEFVLLVLLLNSKANVLGTERCSLYLPWARSKWMIKTLTCRDEIFEANSVICFDRYRQRRHVRLISGICWIRLIKPTYSQSHIDVGWCVSQFLIFLRIQQQSDFEVHTECWIQQNVLYRSPSYHFCYIHKWGTEEGAKTFVYSTRRWVSHEFQWLVASRYIN